MLHISRSVSSAWTRLWCFHYSSLSISKVIAEKCASDFWWPEMTLGTWGGSLVAIFPFRASSIPVTRCFRVFRMVLVQKRRLSIYSYWLIMECSQNWPNLRYPILKFRDITFYSCYFLYQSLKVQDCRSVGVAVRNIHTCSEVRSLDVSWWPDL